MCEKLKRHSAPLACSQPQPNISLLQICCADCHCRYRYKPAFGAHAQTQYAQALVAHSNYASYLRAHAPLTKRAA